MAEAPETIENVNSPISHAAAPKQVYKVQAGVVLSRPPQITRDLHPFEKAFFLYQKRLNERLALPFTRYHYFSRGSPAFKEWQRKFKQRQTPAHEIGVYNAYSKEGWHDELLVGAKESEPQRQVDALLQEAIVPRIGDQTEDAEDNQVEKPASRVTEADSKADLKSLDRLLQRSLYLLVQNHDGRWTFPVGTINTGKENLQQAAERVIIQTAGSNMNTWVVGNQPIGHYEYDFPKQIRNADTGVGELGEKVFFMKARIMGGQANLNLNQFDLRDFKWLASEEIQKLVSAKYWSSIRRMLPQR